jgi:plasmid stabilization system protein ParE
MKIVWTMVAILNLQDIRAYISKYSIRSADNLINKLYNEAFVLERNPYMGRILVDVNDNSVRMLVSGNYKTVYRVTEDKIYILAVGHSARLLNNVVNLKDYD